MHRGAIASRRDVAPASASARQTGNRVAGGDNSASVKIRRIKGEGESEKRQ
jgi:hypothetical protein